MPETILKPNFPPVPLPETSYDYMASVGISRSRLTRMCVRDVDVVGISSIELNTVKVEFDTVVHEDIPVWIHTDYGTRRRWLRGEEAVNPADYFERAALIFPLQGSKATALIEAVGESQIVIGIIGAQDAGLDSEFFNSPKPITPRVGCWPTWKLYLDIEIYCNDWVHVSKNEYPAKDRGYHRLIFDMHEDGVADILNAAENGFVSAEYSFTDADSPTGPELAQKAVIESFLERGTLLGGTHSPEGSIIASSQVETEYVKETEDLFKPDPCVTPGWRSPPTPGIHFDLGGEKYEYGWIEVAVNSWAIDSRIDSPFAPGTASQVTSGTYGETVTRYCEMAGYVGNTKWSTSNPHVTIGLGHAVGEYWCIMNIDGSFADPNAWMTTPFDERSPIPDGDPDLHSVAYQPNLFCERRRYEVGGVELVFDSYNSYIDYTSTATAHLDENNDPNGFYTQEKTFSAVWNFTVTLNDGSPSPVIHDFNFDINEYFYADQEITDRGEKTVTLANMSPLYVSRVNVTDGYKKNHLHNTLFFSHGIGVATLRDDLGESEGERAITVVSKDNDTVYGLLDWSPGDSILPAPSIDLASIINSFKSRLAANNNEGWWIFPDGDTYEGTLSYQAGHIHVACKSWLVPYNLKEALVL
jgi:hypothetical protein